MQGRVTRRAVLAAGGGAGLQVSSAGLGRAQSGRTARIVVGFAPGGPSDIVGRLLAEGLRGGYAPQAIVENRTIPRGEGERHEFVAADGTKRVIRVIAAGVIPVPENVAEQIAASRQAPAPQQTAANAPAPEPQATRDAVTTGSIGPEQR